ncbi:MAG: hypothetical protein H7841_06285 [Magnetospirillum sp. WYHS-4]
MSFAQRQMLIGRYATFLKALNAAALRSCSPDQAAFYRRYASRVSGMLADLQPTRH